MTKKITLNEKIKKVLITYFKTQFLLVVVTILAVWGIMALIPEIHIIYETLIASFSFIVIAQILDLLISPIVFGKKLDINPFIVFVSLFIGITFFGIIGAIFAVPFVLVVKTVWEHYREEL